MADLGSISGCAACDFENLTTIEQANHTCGKQHPNDYDPDTHFVIVTDLTNGSIDHGYTLDNYQADTGRTAFYPNSGNGTTDAINYCVLGLAGEAGELPNHWKKYFRDFPNDGTDDEKRTFTESVKSKLVKEAGDALWYISQLSTELGISLSELATANIDKLADRKERDVLRGSGDDR